MRSKGRRKFPDFLPHAAPSNPQTPTIPDGLLQPQTPIASEPGAASGREMGENCPDQLPDAAPLRFGGSTESELGGTSGQKLGDMILNFKSVTTRRINHLRKMTGLPVWQRNYYDKIIRDKAALQTIRAYIQANPVSWGVDPLYPDNLSG